MPNLKKIREFEKRIQSLAGEPEYLEERGETFVSVLESMQDDVAADLADLFEDDVSQTSIKKSEDPLDLDFTGLDDLIAPDDLLDSIGEFDEDDVRETEEAEGASLENAEEAEEVLQDDAESIQDEPDFSDLFKDDDKIDFVEQDDFSFGDDTDFTTDDLASSFDDVDAKSEDDLIDFDDVSALMDGLLDDSSQDGEDFLTDFDVGSDNDFAMDDMFSLDGLDAVTTKLGDEDVAGVDDFSPSAMDDLDDDIQDFSLEEVTDDLLSLDIDGIDSFFDSDDSQDDEEDDLAVSKDKPSRKDTGKKEEREYRGDGFYITKGELEKIKFTLIHLPRNLKIAVQEFIGDGDYPEEEIIELINLLIKGAAPKKIAEFISEKTGEQISLPAKYLTMSGIDFLTEETSPWYIFKKKVLPLLLKTTVSLGLLIFTLYLAFAVILPYGNLMRTYKQGYAELNKRNYHESVRLFDKAFEIKPIKKWYFKYADAYIYNRQYVLAQQTYEKILAHRWDKKAVLDSARLESFIFEDYEKAQSLIDLFLEFGNPKNLLKSEYFKDYDLRMSAFWTNMKWAETDPSKIEVAGYHLMRLLTYHGNDLRVIQTAMYYNFVTGDTKLFNQLKKFVFEKVYTDKKIKYIDVDIAIEMAKYLYEENELDQFQNILRLLREKDKNIPEVYQLQARYLRDSKKYDDERRNLNICLSILDSSIKQRYFPEADRFYQKKYLAMRAEVYNSRGENNRIRNLITKAESDFQKSADVYYNLKERRIVQEEERFGKIFYNLGSLYYDEVNNLDVAHAQFNEAVENGFWKPDMGYKLAYIQYSNEDFADSLLQFYKTDLEVPQNPAILYSIANTLYKRNNLNSAKGYYSHLLGILEERRSYFAIEVPNKVEHIDILYGLVLGYNNLGVTSYELYKRTGDKSYINEAYLSFVQANQYKDRLSRDSITYERPKWYSDIMDKSYPVIVENNVPLLNIAKVNSIGKEQDLIFFTKIPKNLEVFPFISSDLKTMADYIPYFEDNNLTSSIFD